MLKIARTIDALSRNVAGLSKWLLVPMFGIGMNGAWAARYGSFGPRLNPTTKPSHRRIE